MIYLFVDRMVAAVVSGGGSGIGRAVCLEFADMGISVVVADINRECGEETVCLVNKLGKGSAVFLFCDVTKTEDLQASIDLCERQFGQFDIMCNNAGIGGTFGSFNDTSNIENGIKCAQQVIAINLSSVVIGTVLAIKHMREKGKGGIIINTASMGGIFPMAPSPVYAATKSAVIHFTRSLETLAAEDIQVSAICPTYTVTKLTTKDSQQGRMEKEIGGKLLVPSDVAKGFRILVQDKASGGKIMRVTKRGLDYWQQRSTTQPCPRL